MSTSSQLSLLFLCVLFIVLAVFSHNTNGLSGKKLNSGVPEQIHLALTENTDEMNIAWVTLGQGSPTSVHYGTSPSSLSPWATNSVPYTWMYGGITRVAHNVTLKGLKESTQYYYQIDGSAKVYSFKTFSKTPTDVKISVFGDLGLTGLYYKGEGQSIESLLKEAAKGTFDMVIHVGDIAYDLHSENGTVGDGYMNKLEPLMATMPYMVIAGNHEDDGLNFTNYKNRFQMPAGSGDGMFYSFNLGPIHFVGINTENYGYYYAYGMESVFTQYNWLEKDLKSVDRSVTPWVISYQHRPFYCSNDNSGECTAFENKILRFGFIGMPGLEPLFLKYGMDISFWGHEHSYERFLPIANKMYYSDVDPYHNAAAPIYIVTGSAGCHSGYANFVDPPLPFSAKQVNDYGYSVMTLKNRTHLYLEQISIEKNDAVVDSVWISKSQGFTHDNSLRSNSLIGRPFPASNYRFSGCHPKDSGCLKQLRKMNVEL